MAKVTSWFLGILATLFLLTVVGFGAYFLGRRAVPSQNSTPEATALPIFTPLSLGTELPLATATPAEIHTPSPTPTVLPTPVPFQITGLTASVSPGDAPACSPTTAVFNFSATITASAPGTATYKWERSDHASTPSVNLAFTSPGSKTVTTSWTLSRVSGETYNGWEKVHVLTPNDISSNQATFTVHCP